MGLLNLDRARDQRTRPSSGGRDILSLPAGRDARPPRQGHRDDLPGSVRVPSPDAPRRRPDRRGGHSHTRRSRRRRRRSRPSSCSRPLGIPERARTGADYPHQFSGGMRQRAMIAMALVHNPSVLIADEPTTALDVTVQAQILELIERVKQEFDIGVILITHDLGVIAETADTVLVMYAGRAMEYGPARELFSCATAPVYVGPAQVDADDRAAASRSSSRSRARRPRSSPCPAGVPFHPRCPYALRAVRRRSCPSSRCCRADTSTAAISRPSRSKRDVGRADSRNALGAAR